MTTKPYSLEKEDLNFLVKAYFLHTAYDWITVDSDGVIMSHSEEPIPNIDNYWWAEDSEDIAELNLTVPSWEEFIYHRSEV